MDAVDWDHSNKLHEIVGPAGQTRNCLPMENPLDVISVTSSDWVHTTMTLCVMLVNIARRLTTKVLKRNDFLTMYYRKFMIA